MVSQSVAFAENSPIFTPHPGFHLLLWKGTHIRLTGYMGSKNDAVGLQAQSPGDGRSTREPGVGEIH